MKRTAPHTLVLLVLVTAPVAVAGSARPVRADETGSIAAHLLAGVRAFRADRHEEALREFRIVEQAGGAEDLALYLGPTLYKLDRLEEARAVLARAHRGPARDAVTDYYLGLTYYRLGLARLARGVFAALDAESAGPKLAAAAGRFIAAIDAQPSRGSVAARLAAVERAGTPDAAFDEAAEAWLGAVPGSSERARAAALMVRLAEPAGAALTALDLLDGDPSLPPDLRLPLLRLAVRAGALARARPLLDDLRRSGDPAARTAAEELARGRQ